MENKKKTLREHGVEYTYDERFLPLTQKEIATGAGTAHYYIKDGRTLEE